ncbi:hypothetical protein ILUMI_21951 [Ignelater luminosus]|uniref:Tetratricopeptide repeat protein 27 n=1 Tax=Ignelater luminosus TaxID=2038154 RepID=A0A8K0CFF3_IGNLU|nr:hypothetical protein ILUMI_21951 [Ignelater luminosus]
MTTTEKLLEQFLIVSDSNLSVNDKFMFSIKETWESTILNTSCWSQLLPYLCEDERLVPFFESLSKEERKKYFKFGLHCIINFVQANFTGPALSMKADEFFKDAFFGKVDFRKQLSVNNEDINVNTKYPALLYTAKQIFKWCNIYPLLNLWWQWRTVMIHQHVLEELSQVLLSQADSLNNEISNLSLEGRLKAKFEIERAQLFNTFRTIFKSRIHLETAKSILGISYELQGKLGKRTKFQEKDLAQLMLHVTLNDDNAPTALKQEVPKNVTLEDDVRLDTIKYKEDSNAEMIIPELEQQALLASVQKMLISKPQDDLYYEEVKPFLDLLLTQNNTWTLRATILLIRCKLERNHKRTIERSLLQCEEICNCIKKETPHPLYRVNEIYATNFQPVWKTEAQLAEIMLNLGMIKASLDIYLQLQLWEEVIVCYTILQMRHKATEIIKQELEKNPTVKLWCLLGDATDDVSCYEKAWEMSKKRSSRAQRHWGQFYFSKKQYQQCIVHFEKSVSINPLQANVWLHYGFAALEIENWQAAATAYRRYTTLEPGNFEAWNNLAKAYIKLNNKRSAHQALLDAVKCNYDNWKVWDNLMVVSADIAHFSDIIRAYHRILDLKEKHLDIEVLRILVYGVCNNANDFEGHPASRLLQKTRELLGRITALFPGEGEAWELYATLAPDMHLRAQRLQRAIRGFMQSGWEKNPKNCQQVLSICHRLAELALSEEIKPTDALIHSIKLSLTSALTTIKRQNFQETLSTLLNEVESLLEKVIKKCKSANVDTKA